MIGFFKRYFVFECPYCGEKCVRIWEKYRAFHWSKQSKCKKCGVILKYGSWLCWLNVITTVLTFTLFFYIAKTFQPVNTFLLGFFPIAMQSFVYILLVWFAKLRYRPDGKHPERIFKKEAQTLYGTMIFYVEDNVLYEKDYVIRVINQEQEVEFRITRESFTSSNTVDLVYNDDRQSIFRIFNHFVTLQTGEMTVSSSFNVS